MTKEPNCGVTIMDFPIMTPATIADHAREMFKKDTGCANALIVAKSKQVK